MTHPRDIGDSDDWALLLAVHAGSFLLGSVLGLEQVVVT